MTHPINILERYWKFTSFRGNQEAIIDAVLQGEDTFALMPTGGGKSLCFQIPALIKAGICIVISPLVALMKDQVRILNNKGIKAIALTGGIPHAEIDTLLDNCIYGNYKFLYISPERLEQDIVQDRIRQMNVNLIAVDEAHCISQWGNDFRPAYKNIITLRRLQPTVNVIALTATARPKVVDDIAKELDFINPKIIRQSFARPNLAYMVLHEEDKLYRLEQILKTYSDPSIVYVRNRRSTVDIAKLLSSKGIMATFYHGGLNTVEKESNMNAWLNNQKQVMVATNAFGMGIDKPDVKTVVHLSLPESIESYFQEAGRAGRNGKKSFALILKNKGDEALVKNQFLKVLPTVDLIKQIYRKLSNYFQISYGEGQYATFDFDFNHFCKTYGFNGILCYNVLQALDRNSVINLSKQFKSKNLVQFIVSSSSVFNYINHHPEHEHIIKSILRSYGGVFDHQTNINTLKIADKASVTEKEVLSTLEQLATNKVVTLNQSKTDAQITFIEPREDDKTINRIAKVIKTQNRIKEQQINAMVNYINNEDICKSMQLLSYFGERNLTPCGICSVCADNKRKTAPSEPKDVKKEIIRLLESGDMSSRSISQSIPYSDEEIKMALKLLLEHEVITITASNTYKLSHL